jgi:hypothetical protein
LKTAEPQKSAGNRQGGDILHEWRIRGGIFLVGGGDSSLQDYQYLFVTATECNAYLCGIIDALENQLWVFAA